MKYPRVDVREIQLAKDAICAGAEVLMRDIAAKADKIIHLINEGTSGIYLNLDKALKLGMFPKIPRACYHQMGNAAGVGAIEMLILQAIRVEADAILDGISYK